MFLLVLLQSPISAKLQTFIVTLGPDLKLNAGQPPMHSLVASRAKGLRTPLFPMTQSIKQSSINQIKIKQTPSFCGALFLAPRLGPCISPPSTLLCATVEGEIAPVGLFRAVLCNSLGLPIIL